MTERIGVIISNGEVVNTILWADHTAEQLADDGYEHFEEVTGMFPVPRIGWTWDSANGYRPPKPYESWSWNGMVWEAPVAQPGDNYVWNEQTKTWDEIPTEEPTP